jgi:hypothetical protein
MRNSTLGLLTSLRAYILIQIRDYDYDLPILETATSTQTLNGVVTQVLPNYLCLCLSTLSSHCATSHLVFGFEYGSLPKAPMDPLQEAIESILMPAKQANSLEKSRTQIQSYDCYSSDKACCTLQAQH